MFQTNSTSLIHGRICIGVMVHLYLRIGFRTEYLGVLDRRYFYKCIVNPSEHFILEIGDQFRTRNWDSGTETVPWLMYRSEAGFPSLGTIDIWDQILLCCSGHHRMFEPIFSFYPVMPVSYVLRCVNSVFRHWHMSPGSNFIFLSWFREFLTAELSIFSWALSRHSKLLCCRDH